MAGMDQSESADIWFAEDSPSRGHNLHTDFNTASVTQTPRNCGAETWAQTACSNRWLGHPPTRKYVLSAQETSGA